MKKTIYVILLIAGCFSVINAQKGVKGKRNNIAGGNQEKMLQEMTTKLSLTTDQQDKVRSILTEGKNNMKSNRQKYKGNKKCLAQAKYQNRKAVESKMMAVLTPEQQTKLQEEKLKKKEEKRRKREEMLSKPIDCSK